MSAVQAYQTRQTIKTYVIGEPDINPFISEFLGSLLFYPYPLKNNLTQEVKDVAYNLFCLENEYFKIAVLPDLGGKLYAAVDKRNNRDIFYCNPVVKPQLIGCTGAWTSGGIEFNFPNRGHRPSATDGTDAIFRNYEDGSASVTICDIDLISWQWFTVELRLYPHKAYLEQTVRLYNPNDYRDSYYVWSTSAAPEAPGLEYRYPFLWHTDEEARTKHLWPFGKYQTDLRYFDSMKAYTLPFGSEVLKDYCGLYDPGRDGGVVHVADYRLVPGKKAWAWGSATAGRNWCQRLAEDGAGYVELQAGAVETQNQFNFIGPHTHLEYREYWLHSSDNGPLCAASKDVIASYTIGDGLIDFRFVATDQFAAVDFSLWNGAALVFQKAIVLNPLHSTRISVPFTPEWLNADLQFRLVCGTDILLEETVLENDDILAMIDAAADVSAAETRDSDLAKAVDLEKRRHYNQALRLYDQICAENRECVPAQVHRAGCYLKKHDAQKALAVLEAIIPGNPEDIELIYHYALALWRSGQRLKAVKYFFKVPHAAHCFAAASYFIALYHFLRREYRSALEKLAYSLEYHPFHYKSLLLDAYILAQTGKANQAVAILRDYLRRNPVDYLAMYLLDRIAGTAEYTALVMGQRQNVYTVLDFLDETEDWRHCRALLEAYETGENAAPLLKAYKYYYLQYEDPDSRDRLIAALEALPLDYNFPNHRIDLKILATALDCSAKAQYLYGLMQYRAENYDLALQYWNRLAAQDFPYSVLYRNLAYYHFKMAQDYAQTRELAEKGLTMQPFNDEFYYLLSMAYRALNLPDQLRKLLDSLERFTNKTEPCIRVWIDLLNYRGEHEKAVAVLEQTDFSFWEIDPEGLVPYVKIYQESYLGLARKALASRDYRKALDAVENCLKMVKKHEDHFAAAYFYAGLIREKLGRFQEALAYYRQICAANIACHDAEYGYLVKAAHRVVKLNWVGIK